MGDEAVEAVTGERARGSGDGDAENGQSVLLTERERAAEVDGEFRRRRSTGRRVKIEGDGTLLRIFVGESDTWHGKPLYQAIVERVRAEGLAGATVLRGIEGFGASSRIHTSRILRLSEDLPVVIELVDEPERIEQVLPLLDEMVSEGMVTLERVRIVAYRSRDDSGS